MKKIKEWFLHFVMLSKMSEQQKRNRKDIIRLGKMMKESREDYEA